MEVCAARLSLSAWCGGATHTRRRRCRSSSTWRRGSARRTRRGRARRLQERQRDARGWSPAGEQAVITDFGLAREVGGRRWEVRARNDGIAGTPAYMAPEQVRRGRGTGGGHLCPGSGALRDGHGNLAVYGRTPWEAALRRAEAAPAVAAERGAGPSTSAGSTVILRCLSREPGEVSREPKTWRKRSRDAAPAVSRRCDAPAEPGPQHPLPAERDAFVGREGSSRSSGGRLAGRRAPRDACRYGRHGKDASRRVLRMAALGTWPGGAWFCDLTEARSPTASCRRWRDRSGVELGRDDPVAQLGHAIAGRGQCLVILDNFEQVVEYARETVSPWSDAQSRRASW